VDPHQSDHLIPCPDPDQLEDDDKPKCLEYADPRQGDEDPQH
jgi:hypothetical protein